MAEHGDKVEQHGGVWRYGPLVPKSAKVFALDYIVCHDNLALQGDFMMSLYAICCLGEVWHRVTPTLILLNNAQYGKINIYE